MAIVKINAPFEWGYDTASKELIALFVEPMPLNEADPVTWRPTSDYVVRIPLPVVPNKIPHV